MRNLPVLSLLVVAALLTPAVRAQEVPSPVTVGLFASLGLGISAKGTIGGFAEYSRWRVSPGLDLRADAGDGTRGLLVGPRVSFRLRRDHIYSEVLAGPNYITNVSDPSGTLIYNRQNGVATSVLAGVELEESRNFRWRVLEYSHKWFTGAPNSDETIWATGLVLRLP